MPTTITALAPLPDTTPVVDPDRTISDYWRIWIYALWGAVNELKMGVVSGNGTPQGVVVAPIGTVYRRLDGGAGTSIYVKEANPGLATGWVAK